MVLIKNYSFGELIVLDLALARDLVSSTLTWILFATQPMVPFCHPRKAENTPDFISVHLSDRRNGKGGGKQ